MFPSLTPPNSHRLWQTPIVLVACGSFSPITNAHLRMFELAAKYIKEGSEFELIGGYLSPVSDAYQRPGLASGTDRARMCKLAADKLPWLMVDDWECTRPGYTPTAEVLKHFAYHINNHLAQYGSQMQEWIVLLCGVDLVQTMDDPTKWTPAEVNTIIKDFGLFVVERDGAASSSLALSKKPMVRIMPQSLGLARLYLNYSLISIVGITTLKWYISGVSRYQLHKAT